MRRSDLPAKASYQLTRMCLKYRLRGQASLLQGMCVNQGNAGFRRSARQLTACGLNLLHTGRTHRPDHFHDHCPEVNASTKNAPGP